MESENKTLTSRQLLEAIRNQPEGTFTKQVAETLRREKLAELVTL